MVTLTVDNGEAVPPMGRGLVAAREFALRIIGAVLQIGATIAVVQVLPPTVAGIYFKGVIIAYGLAALLRGKYELFIAQHFVNPQQSELGARARAVASPSSSPPPSPLSWSAHSPRCCACASSNAPTRLAACSASMR